MGPVFIQVRPQFETLWRTGFDAKPASFAFFGIDRDFTARLGRHDVPRRFAIVFSGSQAESAARNLLLFFEAALPTPPLSIRILLCPRGGDCGHGLL
jgi:hypothetical protein